MYHFFLRLLILTCGFAWAISAYSAVERVEITERQRVADGAPNAW